MGALVMTTRTLNKLLKNMVKRKLREGDRTTVSNISHMRTFQILARYLKISAQYFKMRAVDFKILSLIIRAPGDESFLPSPHQS